MRITSLWSMQCNLGSYIFSRRFYFPKVHIIAFCWMAFPGQWIAFFESVENGKWIEMSDAIFSFSVNLETIVHDLLHQGKQLCSHVSIARDQPCCHITNTIRKSAVHFRWIFQMRKVIFPKNWYEHQKSCLESEDKLGELHDEDIRDIHC